MLDVQQLQRYLASAVASAPLLACVEVSSLHSSIVSGRSGSSSSSLHKISRCCAYVRLPTCCLVATENNGRPPLTHTPCCCLCFLGLQPSFLPNYLQIASRKLLLFHGRHSRQQRRSPNTSSSSGGLVVRLGELVNSPVMAELQEMLLLGPAAEQERDLYNNWFSLQVRGMRRLGPAGKREVCVWGSHTIRQSADE